MRAIRFLAALTRSPGYRLPGYFYRGHRLLSILVPAAVAAMWTAPAWPVEPTIWDETVDWRTIRAAIHMWLSVGSVACGAMAFNAEKRLGTVEQLILTPEPRGVLLPARGLFMYQPFAASITATLCVDGVFLQVGCPGVEPGGFLRYMAMGILLFAFSLAGLVLGLYLALVNRSTVWSTAKGGLFGVLWTCFVMFVVYGIGSGSLGGGGAVPLALALAAVVVTIALRGMGACIESFDHLLLGEPRELASVTRRERRSIRQRRIRLGTPRI
jgi:hypothetical protein